MGEERGKEERERKKREKELVNLRTEYDEVDEARRLVIAARANLVRARVHLVRADRAGISGLPTGHPWSEAFGYRNGITNSEHVKRFMEIVKDLLKKCVHADDEMREFELEVNLVMQRAGLEPLGNAEELCT